MTDAVFLPHIGPRMSRRASLFYYTRCTQFESLAGAGKFRKAAVSLAEFPEFHGGASDWAIRRTDNRVRRTVSTHENGPPIVSTDTIVSSCGKSTHSITHAATERISRSCQRPTARAWCRRSRAALLRVAEVPYTIAVDVRNRRYDRGARGSSPRRRAGRSPSAILRSAAPARRRW